MDNVCQENNTTPVVAFLDSKKAALKLKRVPLTQKKFDEGWIQELIRKNPGLLPVDQLDDIFSPLVCIGREVSTKAGPIDNLFLNPEGFLTIVETKLWRNPEAERKVVSQIIDYAKEISNWSFEDLNTRFKDYAKKYKLDCDDLIKAVTGAGIGETDKKYADMIDKITKNMRNGKFLLLIVGDGIKENVMSMIEYLQKTPQLYFTFGLVELQIFEIESNGTDSLLVIPKIIARTKEIERAVVRVTVENKLPESIVKVDTAYIETGRADSAKKFTLKEEEFFEILKTKTRPKQTDFVHQVIDEMKESGFEVEWFKTSFVIKMYGANTDYKKLSLFSIGTNSKVFAFSLTRQVPEHSKEIAINFYKETANLFGIKTATERIQQGEEPVINGWKESIPVESFEKKYEKFKEILSQTINKLHESIEAGD